MNSQTISYDADLSAVVTRANGQVEDLGIISGAKKVNLALNKPMSWYEKTWHFLKREGKIPVSMGLFAFIAHLLDPHSVASLAVVTTAGVNYMASDFASGSASPHVGALNYHDTGTGTTHGSTSTPTAATATSPSVFTQASHGFTSNDIINVSGITGITGVNGIWEILVISSSSYSLDGSVGGGSGFGGGTNAVQLINGAGDTAMTTSAVGSGLAARVAGTQSNPSANVYRSVATLSFTAPLALVEWGIFSASTSGTLLDRRYFNTAGAPATTASAALVAAPINVLNGDSVSYTYSLTINQGGS